MKNSNGIAEVILHTSPHPTDYISGLSNDVLKAIEDLPYEIKHIGGENIGGKAKNLSILSQGGINVPGGFCIGYESFDYYCKTKGLPEGLVDIVKYMKKILGNTIAIRSSANIEDGHELSAAGVFNSKYIYEDKDIQGAILEIYQDAKSGEIQGYFGNQNANTIKLGLVIQALVDAPDAAGVILSGDKNRGEETIIEYVQGLGNTLVDGKKIGNQIIINEKGEIAHHKQYEHNTYTLTEKDIGNLFQETEKIKGILKLKKVDIEYGIKNEILYIFQARPITTDMLKYASELSGSLSIIYPGQTFTGIIVNHKDFEDIMTMDSYVKKIKAEGKKAIIVSSEPSLELDKIMIQCEGMIMGSSGIASHGAIRAAEYKIGTIGGAQTTLFTTGEIVEFNTTTGTVKNKEGCNMLKPLVEKILSTEEIIDQHTKKVEQYIVPNNEQADNLQSAQKRIGKSISNHLTPQAAKCLIQIVKNNMPGSYKNTDTYQESGYDSCQSRRTLAKIVSHAILIGGFLHEGESLLHIDLSNHPIIKELMTSIKIHKSDLPILKEIACIYGKDQEFLFPGITPSNNDVPDIKGMIADTIQGTLHNSVRTISGVGGLRYDQQRNHVTNFKKFLEIKIQEDKRYYPGLCLAYLLCHGDIDFKKTWMDEATSIKIKNLFSYLQNQKETDYQDAAILCALHLPQETEDTYDARYEIKTDEKLQLLQDFHSPAYELSAFKDARISCQLEDSDAMDNAIENIKLKATKLQTFNSTIHLPRADKLAGLSHSLMGQLKNKNGEFAIRYGLGIGENSVEFYEHHKNNGNICYTLKTYSNKLFAGSPTQETMIGKDHAYYKQIQSEGLFGFILGYLRHE